MNKTVTNQLLLRLGLVLTHFAHRPGACSRSYWLQTPWSFSSGFTRSHPIDGGGIELLDDLKLIGILSRRSKPDFHYVVLPEEFTNLLNRRDSFAEAVVR